jgi:hypothetical protein
MSEDNTCLVIGNGPSLSDIPVQFLRKYQSFGSNRIYLLPDFTPDYYACVNPLVISQFSDEIAAMPARAKYIAGDYIDMVPGSIPLWSIGASVFSHAPLQFVYEGHTVTYVLLQLAYYMGYTRVGLVGVDHYYRYNGAPNQENIADAIDPNHFDPGYFSNVKWNNPDLARSEAAYRLAKATFEADGRRVVNITPGSQLDVFDKEDWKSW